LLGLHVVVHVFALEKHSDISDGTGVFLSDINFQTRGMRLLKGHFSSFLFRLQNQPRLAIKLITKISLLDDQRFIVEVRRDLNRGVRLSFVDRFLD
jgi:hypothetical protein